MKQILEALETETDSKMYEFVDRQYKKVITFTKQNALLDDQIIVITRDVTPLQAQITKKLSGLETINACTAIQYNI